MIRSSRLFAAAVDPVRSPPRTRRPCILIALVLAAAAAAPAAADVAPPVQARDRIPLRARAGEAALVVAKVERGAELQVVGQRGRWLRVRHGRRAGWVTRSQVEPRTEPAPRARAGRSGFSGKRREDALKVAITAERVRGCNDPRTEASCTLELVKDDVAVVLGRGHDGWVLVQSAAGGVGWIPALAVTDAARFVSDPRRAPAEVAAATPGTPPAAAPGTAVAGTAVAAAPDSVPADGEQDAPALADHSHSAAAAGPPPRRIAASLIATAGAETFALRQADAMAIAAGPLASIAAAGRLDVARALWIGLAGAAGISGGDLTYYDPAGQSQPMATRGLVIDAAAEVGWGRAWSIAARGGYHHATLDVESERAEPMLVGERISGVTAGLGGAAPIGRRVAVAASVDVMPAGAHAPAAAATPAATSVRGVWARGTVTVRLPAHLVAALAYRGGAVSAALPDGTTRSDRSHAVTAGLGVTW